MAVAVGLKSLATFVNFGLSSKSAKSQFDLEDLYLNINQCILILMNNYIPRNLVLLFLKKKENS